MSPRLENALNDYEQRIAFRCMEVMPGLTVQCLAAMDSETTADRIALYVALKLLLAHVEPRFESDAQAAARVKKVIEEGLAG